MFSFQTKSAKILWLLIVCFGFIGSGILIRKSYNEWQESPIATSISTYPLDDLDFPIVTICPPKDSNTALYHDLVQAGNETLSEEKRDTLRKAAYEIFLEQSHHVFVNKMSATLNMGNTDQILQGFHSLPLPYLHLNGLKVEMWNINGTITSPWYKSGFRRDYYRKDIDYYMVLKLPKDIRDYKGPLHIEIEADLREEEGWHEKLKYAFADVGPNSGYS